ncbi:MAG: redoxin family protein [Planctomycetota bacterium]|jgi:peroxiredoxin
MSIQVGDTLPDATFFAFGDDGMQQISTADFFKGRKVAAFALFGAYTPPCTNDHVPSYIEAFEALKAKGVEAIACISLNDPFVMNAWAKSMDVGDKITMLADGNGEFTTKAGMELDGAGLGCGPRSKRYAMIVDDGKVTALNVEPDAGVCDVSSGPNLLAALG